MASTVNLRSGLHAVGALRPNEGNAQDPVALETTVIATGARPGGTTAKRELFTEETKTVLVFERGAVIRLSAAVADGQLLFLTNKATGKEVVTQVLRKRAFRPTNCYVDLEFTEPCPGFWGIEFPKAAAPGSSLQIAKKLAVEQDSEAAPAKPAIAPSVQEVERLKNEVAQLQTQLKSLTQPEQNSAFSVAASSGVKAALEISSHLAKKEEEQRLEELLAIETKQELASLPTPRLVAYRQKSGNSTLKNRTQKGAIAACVVLFAVALGVGTYQYRSFFYAPKKTGVVNAASVQPRPVATALVTPLPTQKNTLSDGAAATPNASQASAANNSAISPAVSAATDSAAKGVDTGSSENVIEDRTVAEPNSRRALAGISKQGKNHAAPNASSRRDITPNSAAASAVVSPNNSGVISPGANASGTVPFDYVAPKLVKGSTSVAPPEAIRNYVSGDVTMDALVDTTGHVQTVKVLSGPAKLHATATEVMKHYLYEPAKKNGKPVPAHVQVSLQFWYAP